MRFCSIWTIFGNKPTLKKMLDEPSMFRTIKVAYSWAVHIAFVYMHVDYVCYSSAKLFIYVTFMVTLCLFAKCGFCNNCVKANLSAPHMRLLAIPNDLFDGGPRMRFTCNHDSILAKFVGQQLGLTVGLHQFVFPGMFQAGRQARRHVRLGGEQRRSICPEKVA